VLQALDAGKHVFCEKPLARTAAEAQAIREASRRNQKIVMTGYLYRFHPAFQFVKSLLEQRIIGTPYFALMRLGGRGSASAWKHTAGQGAGAMGEMMAHMIDLATWYFGPTRQATSLWHTTIAPQRVINEESVRATAEDVSVIRLLSGGVQILCESDLLTPSYMQYVEIQGDNGSIFASMLHYLPTVLYCKEPRGIYDRGNSMYSFPQENLFVRELQCFLEAVERNHWELNGLDDSVHVVELLEQLHRGPERRARS
jgi:predicted dehydrogenase